MKIRLLLFALLAVSLLGGMCFAQDQTQDMKAAMAAYEKLAATGPQHEFLASMAGTWKTSIKSWMDPSAPPQESTGSCKQTMVLGGRFLHAECTGQMMDKPFHGMGITGYDNQKQKYVAIWMDTMGTGIYPSEGTETEPGKSLTLTAQMDDPVMGPMQVREVVTVVNKNHHIFEMYGTGKDGKENKMMEIHYTRSGK